MLVHSLLVVMLVASHATADPVAAASTAAKKIRTARDVDWCNFDCGFWKGPLRQGHSEVHHYSGMDDPHDTIFAALHGVIYGDLEGDKRESATAGNRRALARSQSVLRSTRSRSARASSR